jgi:hypothetical protein
VLVDAGLHDVSIDFRDVFAAWFYIIVVCILFVVWLVILAFIVVILVAVF